MPATENVAVAIQAYCHPPATLTNHATTGGPQNCPNELPCCIHPTLVVVVCGLGATVSADTNIVAGIRPPAADNKTTEAN